MRVFKIAQGHELQDDDLIGESYNELLKEISNPSTPSNESPIKRSMDTSVYIKPGVYVFKCATYAGWNLKSINKNASRCHADALQLVEGFKSAGMAAECSDLDNSLIYNGGGTIYIKCTVSVYSKSGNDVVMSLARKLGIKR